jgi:hypothetical protein
VVILVWIALWYVAFSITSAHYHDALRYTTYVALPIALLATRSLGLVTKPTWLRHAALLTLLGLVIWSGWKCYTTRLPAMSDFQALAQLVHREAGERPVLFCCRYDGEFIFERRRLDPQRRGVTLRADKVLVNFSIKPTYGMVSFAEDRADILALLDQYGIELLVIESDDNLRVPQFALLRKIVEGPEFDLLGVFPVAEGYAPIGPDLTLRVYRYREAKPPKDGIVSVPAPQLGTRLQLHIIP